MATGNYFILFILVEILYCVNLGAASKTDGINDTTCSYCNKSNSTNIGVIVPLFTPFKNNTCQVDLDVVCSDAQYFIKKGVDGFLIASKTGEGNSLSTEETMAVIKICVQKIKKMGKIYVSVGPPSQNAQKLAIYAESLGVDGIFTIMSTYANRQILTPQLITTGIKSIADCAPNTPVYFEVDPMAAMGLNVRYYEIFLLSTKQISNFAGMSLGQEYADQIRSYGIFNPQKHALILRNHYSYHSGSYFGCNGIVAVSTTLIPGLAVKAWYAKNYECACRYQDKINKFIVAIASPYSYLSATKTTYSLISGFNQGEVRLPIQRVSCDDKKRIAANLQAMGYKLKLNVTCTDDKEEEMCLQC